jgi:glycerol-3-phosphate cytidylyltransferase
MEGEIMRKIITYGTFDLLHYGHVNLLKRAKELGDYLVVALSTDEFNKEKGKRSYYSYLERKHILESIKYVDLIIPEEVWGQKVQDVIKYDIEAFVIGDDWEGKFDFLKNYCEVIYLPRTEGISSTIVKQQIANTN